MDKREILDEMWTMKNALENKYKEIEIDGMYMNMKDISNDLKKLAIKFQDLCMILESEEEEEV